MLKRYTCAFTLLTFRGQVFVPGCIHHPSISDKSEVYITPLCICKTARALPFREFFRAFSPSRSRIKKFGTNPKPKVFFVCNERNLLPKRLCLHNKDTTLPSYCTWGYCETDCLWVFKSLNSSLRKPFIMVLSCSFGFCGVAALKVNVEDRTASLGRPLVFSLRKCN